jgi:hypothetical protein
MCVIQIGGSDEKPSKAQSEDAALTTAIQGAAEPAISFQDHAFTHTGKIASPS